MAAAAGDNVLLLFLYFIFYFLLSPHLPRLRCSTIFTLTRQREIYFIHKYLYRKQHQQRASNMSYSCVAYHTCICTYIYMYVRNDRATTSSVSIWFDFTLMSVCVSLFVCCYCCYRCCCCNDNNIIGRKLAVVVTVVFTITAITAVATCIACSSCCFAVAWWLLLA